MRAEVGLVFRGERLPTREMTCASFRSISVMCSQCLRKGKESQGALVGDCGVGVSVMVSPTG